MIVPNNVNSDVGTWKPKENWHKILLRILVAEERFGSQKLQASTSYWALHNGCSVAQLHSEFPREIAIVAAFIS